jgi:haloalkane dehalogenase
VVRAGRFFAPWHSTQAIAFDPAAITPPALAAAHLALLQARSARLFHTAYGETYGNP